MTGWSVAQVVASAVEGNLVIFVVVSANQEKEKK